MRYTVTWIDSNIIDHQTDEIADPIVIETVGYLVEDNKHWITLSRDKIGDEWRGQISIPRECIRNIIKDD